MVEQARTPSQISVTVVGAGIAGLTAAQELVLRGFNVIIVDPQINEHVFAGTLDRGIGGMARSQYVVAASDGDRTTLQRWEPGQTFLVDEVVRFNGFDTGQVVFADEVEAKVQLARFAAAVSWLVKRNRAPTSVRIGLPCAGGGDTFLRYARVVRPALEDALRGAGLDLPVDDFLHGAEEVTGPSFGRFTQRLPIVPAEHGFRFFPSFYRHLFDTMKQTRIVGQTDGTPRGRTVFANLVQSDCLAFARTAPNAALSIPRRPISSVEAIRQYLGQVLEQLGYSVDDIKRYALALFKFMTAGSVRRQAEYEDMSWGDFVDLDGFSQVAREHVEFGPQMTAALRGSESDARTQGNITTQLILDQIRPSSSVDCTLNGPTSLAWLDPWQEFLIQQGVKMHRGKLVSLSTEGSDVIPEFEGLAASVARRVESADFIVLALDLPAMYRLAQTSLKSGVVWSDLEKVVHFAMGDVESDFDVDLRKATPQGPLQHLSGIQFYFDTILNFWRGHTQYLDSPWGLTSIAQSQFWDPLPDRLSSQRTVLSVDIGIWDREYSGRTAWDCDADTLATYVWEQISRHHEVALKAKFGPQAKMPVPIGYALDRDVEFRIRDGLEKLDRSPFLVNKTGRYHHRPGRIAATYEGSNFPCYEVHAQRYVMCGTFMKTFTRLTSMESANESARHAVNAVIAASGTATEPCEIWDPEKHELEDLTWLRSLDDSLHKRGLPHFVDILGWNDIPTHIRPSEIARAASLFLR